MGEINVVPYIDVMLVLLVIFMVTAPLLTQGIQVQLPEADADPVVMQDPNQEPLVLSVNREGQFLLSVGDKRDQPIEPDQVVELAAAVLRRNPKIPVLVNADEHVPYGQVVQAMSLLKKAGATELGFLTEPPARPRKGG